MPVSETLCHRGTEATEEDKHLSLVSLPARLLLPSLGVAIFAVTLMSILLVSNGGQALFRDSDSGWHIRNGERILAERSVPRSDPFSFTRQGREWFAWEWLSDVALGTAHRAGGLRAVALLAATTIACAALASSLLALRLGANFFLVAGGAALLLGVTSIHWLARPHIFSWLLALPFVYGPWERRRLAGFVWFLPFLSLVWANMHASFLLGPAILLIYAPWNRILFRVALACLAATFVNPYGWRLHQHVFDYLRNSYLMDRISEFRSFSFHSPAAIYVELFLLVAVAGGLLALRRRAWPQALVIFALVQMGLYSARHLPTAAVLLLPMSLAMITAELRTLPRLEGFHNYSDRLLAWDRQMLGVVPMILAVLLAAGVMSLRPVGFHTGMFPVQAASFFEGREAQARLFARDQWGGYLIYRFDGRLKVFVDGRSDFYGNDFLERYAEVADVRPGWDRVLDEERVNYVLVRPDQALAQALRASGKWRVARGDSVAVIFERV